jgi:hypothetical protein
MSTGHLTVKLETITPEQAAIWLTRNRRNRPIRRTRVARYADAMRRGHWRVNGEAVIFDSEGNLLNGQHRLADYPDVADFVPAEPQVRVNGRFVPADAPTLL